MNSNLVKNVKFTLVETDVAAGQTEVDSSIVDMAGYDGVLFVAALGDVTDASVLTLKAQDNSVNSTTGMADITGATTGAITASTNSDQLLIVDVYRPQKEFVRAVLTRTAQNAVINSIVAIQYRSSRGPVTQDTSVLSSVLAAF
ncbi:MAG: hypothetical protein KGO96_12880 [Elusimicrobia bacterium]|nr:hypothetical protein [Elusimicrobiota bacterium]